MRSLWTNSENLEYLVWTTPEEFFQFTCQAECYSLSWKVMSSHIFWVAELMLVLHCNFHVCGGLQKESNIFFILLVDIVEYCCEDNRGIFVCSTLNADKFTSSVTNGEVKTFQLSFRTFLATQLVAGKYGNFSISRSAFASSWCQIISWLHWHLLELLWFLWDSQ